MFDLSSQIEDRALVPVDGFVGGAFVAGSGRFAVTDPASGETVAEVARLTADDARRAVDAADAAFPAWAAALPQVRSALLRRWYEAIVANREDLARIMTAEQGKPLSEARGGGVSRPGPMLVWFHGGGFVCGDLDTHDAACRFLSERSGVRVLSVDYRLAPEAPFPAAHDDCEASYRWVVEHAASWGADPALLAVGGDSAGGTLAAAVAIVAARDGLPLAFQLLIYPATDWGGETESRRLYNRRLVLTQEFMDVARTAYLPGAGEVRDPRASPLLAELPDGLAPAYVATAGFDPLRDEGEAYARKLAAAGVPVEMHRFPDQIHGFMHLVGVGRSGRAAMAEIAERLRAGLA